MKILSSLLTLMSFQTIRLLFVFGTQMKTFLIKSKRFLSRIENLFTQNSNIQNIHKEMVK